MKTLKFLILIQTLCSFSFCSKEISNSIAVRYHDRDEDQEITVVLSDMSTKTSLRFSEKYIIREDPPFRYVDIFHYQPPFGLFREIKFEGPAVIEKTIVQAHDFLWLYDAYLHSDIEYFNIRKDDLTKRKIITYTDREYFGEWEYGKEYENSVLDLENVKILLYDVVFDSLYSDTLRTFLFEISNTEQLGFFKEYKVYDSMFNLVAYIPFFPNTRDSTVYKIKLDDYLELKKFRKERGLNL